MASNASTTGLEGIPDREGDEIGDERVMVATDICSNNLCPCPIDYFLNRHCIVSNESMNHHALVYILFIIELRIDSYANLRDTFSSLRMRLGF
jgi:hypothetical protein